MAETLSCFKPTQNYLICVDSDGCAMDTMDIKHFRCFGPCMVKEWNLEPWAKPILQRWNQINLYTMTRGINRFKGLALALREINQRYTAIDGILDLEAWVDTAPELSNAALEQKIQSEKCPIFHKALRWSQAVNAAINALPEDTKKPFPGAAEGLTAAHEFADVAVVSSANREAVLEEWARWNLLDQVDVLCCQDSGSKAHCIAMLKEKGYSPDHILMVGDAPGDKAAAERNGVYYYPILVRHEAESWKEFRDTALEAFRTQYKAYGDKKAHAFLENLNS